MNGNKENLRPGSNDPVYCRGLSKKDYNVAMQMIRRNLVTDKELVQAGKMLPPSEHKGRPVSEAFKWFMEVKEKGE
tara:strand:- start:3249 stop:3476 length:228 start_codon:yes stop_codon:yes gene_type:complete